MCEHPCPTKVDRMKLAIMQPYIFPYLGYFQLIRAVDTFVVFDDVAYINRGWINRNYILALEARQLFTVPVSGGSQNRLINQLQVYEQPVKLIKTVQQRYGKAPHFRGCFPLIEEILLYPEKNLAHFLDHGLRQICTYLGIHPSWYVSSALKKDNSLCGQEKVLALCQELGATQYINLPGGETFYDHTLFDAKRLQLSFIQPRLVKYRQFGESFVPNLSIIDVMMFNGMEGTRLLLEEYDIVSAPK